MSIARHAFLQRFLFLNPVSAFNLRVAPVSLCPFLSSPSTSIDNKSTDCSKRLGISLLLRWYVYINKLNQIWPSFDLHLDLFSTHHHDTAFPRERENVRAEKEKNR
jgi:hypothetical protein